jgi:Protein of unknown function (DUF3667)
LSSLKEREDKNCLNCNAIVAGRYCQICGQENTEIKETAFQLVSHYFQDLIHFDGKFFSSIKYLLFKPGFLVNEYNIGRRASHLNPVKMYVFTSAMFFLLFFAVIDPAKTVQFNDDYNHQYYLGKLDSTIAATNQKLSVAKDSSAKIPLSRALDSLKKVKTLIANDSIAGKNLFVAQARNQLSFDFSSKQYKSLEHYNSVQNQLPTRDRDGYLSRLLIKKSLQLDNEYRGNPGLFLRSLMDKFIHKFPQIFFVSLPFFALILKLLYWRNKQQYYVNHVVFTIYYFVFVFIVVALLIGLTKLSESLYKPLFGALYVLLNLWIYYYLYKAMRYSYAQSRIKTLSKFALLLISVFLLITVTFVLFFFITIFQL